MKILIIHNFHRSGSASGDDLVFTQEADLLEAHGHTVIRYSVINDSFDRASPLRKLILAGGMLWSFRHYRAIRRICRNEKPDIVHVHTFFPLLSPSVLYAAKRAGCPVAATLHDTRLVCPCATSLYRGTVCNLCGDGHYLRMVKRGCFKGSRIQSLYIAVLFRFHRIRRSFFEQIDRCICLNSEQIALLESNGFDPARMVKKYNFVPEPPEERSDDPRLPSRYVVYYGRIGEEKGIRPLMEIWDKLPDIPLVVMGDGPLAEEFLAWKETKPHVLYLGYTEHKECLRIVRGAEFIVFPPIWYEGCSLVQLEAKSLGKPILTFDIGFSSESVEEGKTGYKIAKGDLNGFAEKITGLWNDPELCREMGRHSRLDYERRFAPEDNLRQLLAVYRELLKKEM